MWGYLYGRDFGPFAQLAGMVGPPPPPFLEPGTVLFSIINIVNWEFIGYNMIIIYAALAGPSLLTCTRLLAWMAPQSPGSPGRSKPLLSDRP